MAHVYTVANSSLLDYTQAAIVMDHFLKLATELLAHPDATISPEVQRLAPDLGGILRHYTANVPKEDFAKQHFLLQGAPALGVHILHHMQRNPEERMQTARGREGMYLADKLEFPIEGHNAVFASFPLKLAQQLSQPEEAMHAARNCSVDLLNKVAPWSQGSNLSHPRIWEIKMPPNALGWGLRRSSSPLEDYTFSTTFLSRMMPQTRFYVRQSETLTLVPNPERARLPSHLLRDYPTRVLSPTLLFVTLVSHIESVFDSESRRKDFDEHRFGPYLLEMHIFMCLLNDPAFPELTIDRAVLDEVKGAAYGYNAAAYWLLTEFAEVKKWIEIAAELAWNRWGLKHAANGVGKPASLEALTDSMERSAEEMKAYLLLLLNPLHRGAFS